MNVYIYIYINLFCYFFLRTAQQLLTKNRGGPTVRKSIFAVQQFVMDSHDRINMLTSTEKNHGIRVHALRIEVSLENQLISVNWAVPMTTPV